MKNIKKTIFTITLLFVLSACSSKSTVGTLDWQSVKNNGEGISLESKKIANYNLSFDSDAFQNAMKNADDDVVNRKSIYTFSGDMNKVNSLFSNLRVKLNVARAKYYAYGKDEHKNTFNTLYEQYLSFYSWYYAFLQHVKSSSPEIYNAFFADMSEAEIEEYITNFLYTEQTKKLDTEINDIHNEQEEAYNQFITDFRAKKIVRGDSGWNEFLNSSLNRFRDVMTKGNEYASCYGFDNYLDYVYAKWYNRNYQYDFVDDYAVLFDNYVVPSLQYYIDNVDNSIIEPKAKKALFENYISSNIANSACFQGDALDAYVKQMGGEMANSYSHLKKDGYYIFSNDSNSLGTAYVSSGIDDPVIFFSKNYQNITTIVHEFGHYNAAYVNQYNYSFPFDVEETHSQGNEMLFNYFITSYYADSEDLDVYKYIQDYEVYDMLSGAILPTAVAQVETYIFENLDKSNEELMSTAETMMGKYRNLIQYGSDLIYAYWASPIVSSTGYYISYSTSGVAAVGVYLQAKENYAKAKENYRKLVTYPEAETDIDTIFTYSGLYSPLKESTFEKLTPANLYSF